MRNYSPESCNNATTHPDSTITGNCAQSDVAVLANYTTSLFSDVAGYQRIGNHSATHANNPAAKRSRISPNNAVLNNSAIPAYNPTANVRRAIDNLTIANNAAIGTIDTRASRSDATGDGKPIKDRPATYNLDTPHGIAAINNRNVRAVDTTNRAISIYDNL